MDQAEAPVTETEPEPDQGIREHWFTVQEAADNKIASRSTLKRRLAEQAFPRAKQSDGSDGRVAGTWLIPMGDLVQAGLEPKRYSPPDPDQKVVDLNREPEVEVSADEMAQLRRDNASKDLRILILEKDNEGLRKEVSRLEAHVTSMDRAMMILEAGPRPIPKPARSSEESSAPPQKKRFWQRS